MPKISAQGKTCDPFRTVNRSIRPIIGNLRLQERVPGQEYPDCGAVGCLPRSIDKKSIDAVSYENLSPCWCKVGQCRRMKPFAITASQGESAYPLGVKRL